VAFGDSFTYGHELSDCPTNDYPTHSNLTYAALVAKQLGMDYQCHAVGASANNAISRKIIEQIDTINQNDLVLVMWTFPIRKEFLLEGDMGYRSLSPSDDFEFALTYYRYLDTNPIYLINETLKEIYLVQTLLEAQGIKYIFMTADTGTDIAITEKNQQVHGILVNMITDKNWFSLENNSGFYDWSRKLLRLTFTEHPPDAAHHALAQKLLKKINETS